MPKSKLSSQSTGDYKYSPPLFPGSSLPDLGRKPFKLPKKGSEEKKELYYGYGTLFLRIINITLFLFILFIIFKIIF